MSISVSGSGHNSTITLYDIHQGNGSFRKDTSTTHSQVQLMQEALTNLGYDTKGADGKFGNDTLAHTRLFSAIENTMERIDTTFTTLSSTAMQAMNGRYFSTQYIARTPTVFTEIRSSLETINFSNSLLQGGNVSFYSPATPSTFYTEMGTYNEKYFRHYRTEDGKKLEAKEIFDTIDYCRFLPCYSLDQSVVFNNSLDIIYAQKGQTGAYLIFSIVEQPLKTLLSLDTYHPEQILVMDSAGRRLYPLNLEITQAQEKWKAY